uniref:Uncharacterized protein n=1 Tax=Micrurus spixii TaxID=129469 RepID=A0A2D4LSK2_9SAUR
MSVPRICASHALLTKFKHAARLPFASGWGLGMHHSLAPALPWSLHPLAIRFGRVGEHATPPLHALPWLGRRTHHSPALALPQASACMPPSLLASNCGPLG